MTSLSHAASQGGPRDTLDLTADIVDLTAALVDVPSVSGSEARLADAVEAALRGLGHLDVRRDGDAVVARTDLGRRRRVLLAGHLDTVPIADNLPSHRDGDLLYGCGTCDMKGGVAVMLAAAARVPDPVHDVTFVLYDNEEVEAVRNGLGRLERQHPEWLAADLAILLEPTAGRLEGGCQGTLRVVVGVAGRRAHSARSWLGDNAIHRAAPVLAALAEYRPRRVVIDGLEYREGLNAVRIDGGVAGNVVPDRCDITVNYRFAPDRSGAEAEAHVRGLFEGYDVELTDLAPGALPGLARPAAAEFATAVRRSGGGEPVAKLGWTDVSRFAALGVPAVNFGPGDPALAHTREENVDVRLLVEAERIVTGYLSGRIV